MRPLLIGFLLVVPAAYSQSSPPTVVRDPQAISVLTQSVNAAGGLAAVGAIQDYTATGNITYYWAGEAVQGTVTLKGRGCAQFRLDASLQTGIRTWAVSNGTGFIEETDGSRSTLPPHNTVNLGSLTFPLTYLAAALQDPSATISYVGLETRNGIQVQHIRLMPTDYSAELRTRDFFINPTTFLIVSTLDMLHPENQSNINFLHEVRFSNYGSVNGISVPFSVVELVSGQLTSTIGIATMSFNTGLQDADFQ